LLLIIALLIPVRRPPTPPDGGLPDRVFQLEQAVSRNEGLLNSNVSTTALGNLRLQKLEVDSAVLKGHFENKNLIMQMLGEVFAEKKGSSNGKSRRVRDKSDPKRKATERSLVETSGLRPIDGGKEEGKKPEKGNPK
jgi:hypothetical protein